MFRKVGDFFRKLAGSRVKPATPPVISGHHRPAADGGRAPVAKSGVGTKQRQERSGRAAPAARTGRSKQRGRRDGSPRRTPTRPATGSELSAPQPAREVTWDPADFDVPPEPGRVRFHDLNLPPELMHAIYDLGFRYCTPIQAALLSHTLAGGDATGRAQTGTGKTAAFLITILTHFNRTPPPSPGKKGAPRALVLAPTRELVLQIEKDAEVLSRYTRWKTMAVFGGMDYRKQQQLLKGGLIDIIAATPGRLLDFKRKGIIDLSKVEILVIDEADRMLDMGFIPDVRRIIQSTPMKGQRQTLFFSATLTPDVHRLAESWTRNAVQVDVTPPQEITLAAISQLVYITTDEEKYTLLYNLITKHNLKRVMVFTNRRDEAQFLKDRLVTRNIRCGLLTGDVSQQQRVRTLEAFRSGRFEVLVATDVAARGLHIEGVSHVINYSLPLDPQDYVHRIGRTGRAGATGTSVSFATETEAYEIPKIEEFIGRSLPALYPEHELLEPLPPMAEGKAEPRMRRSRAQRDGRQPHGGRQGRPRRGGRQGGPRGGHGA